MWKILLLITVLMGCTTAILATLYPKLDYSPMGEAIIFLIMATFFTALFTAD